MARLTDKDRELILADYHTGEYSQRELARRHGVSVGTISKTTKEEDVQNEHIMNAQTTILRASSILPNEQMNAIMNAAQEKVRRENLVFGNAEKLAQKIGLMADEVADAQDLKTLVDANDKNSITLKVSDRHAKNITAVQVNSDEKKDVKSGMGELYKAIDG